MKKSYKYFLSPIITAFILLILFYIFNLYPFGNSTVSWCDMSQQVVPLLLNLKNILDGQSDFFLNMQNAGGMSFFGVFFFFLSSPLSFLIKFISFENAMIFMNILLIIKMMLCSFSASFFFLKKFKHSFWQFWVLLGVMYAFCGYTMLFYQNIVWLDMMALYPFVLLSFEHMLENKAPGFFIMLLSLAIVLHFYLAFMVSLSLLLLFFAYFVFVFDKEQKNQMCLLFIGSTIISVLVTAPVWLTSLFQYLNSARTGSLLNSLSSGSMFNSIFTNLSCLFCSAIIFSAVTIFIPYIDLFSRKLKAVFFTFIMCFIPAVFEPINKMWHTGSYQAFPMRYGFITIFLAFILTAGVLDDISATEGKKRILNIIECSLFLFFYVLLAGFVICIFYSDIVSYTKNLWVSREAFVYVLIVFVIAFMGYFVCLYQFKVNKISKTVALVLLSCLFIFECCFNSTVYIASAKHGTNVYNRIVDLKDRIDDRDFYRVKLNRKYFEVNMLGALGYPCLNHYTSFTSESFMYTMKKLGYSSYWMEVNSTGGTKFTDALLTNKYVVGNADSIFENDNVIFNNSTFCIFKNNLSLPPAIVLNDFNKLNTELDNKDRFIQQEELYSLMFNPQDPLFTRFDPSYIEYMNISKNGDIYTLVSSDYDNQPTIHYDIHVDDKSTLYFDCFSEISNRLTEKINGAFCISVNGKNIENYYPSKKNNGILELGTFENQDVNVEVLLKKNIQCRSFGVASLNHQNLINGLSRLKPAYDLDISGNKIYLKSDAIDNEYLYLSIPFDKGFSAKVNDKCVEISKVNGTFMKIPLENGSNNIKITYIPQGLIPSVFISISGFVLLFLFIFSLSKNLLNNTVICRTFYCIFISSFIFVFLALYLLPIIIFIFV